MLLGGQGVYEERREDSEDVGVKRTRVAALEAGHYGLPGLDNPLWEVKRSLVESPLAGPYWPLVTGHGYTQWRQFGYSGT